MADIVQYTDIIRIQTRSLVDSDKTYLTTTQREAIERIHQYTEQLAFTANRVAHTSDEHKAIRHELINILTPIIGYIEMLADGWMGRLNPDQMAHVDIVQHASQALRGIILTQRHDDQLSDSA
ncbi:MAG: histidine kinase dimerization/phospho-acceptor domain-containing protein [Chloroflexota bacterium]